LAIQYIRQLIEDPRAYRRILAVTFTNKATTEMKERILEQLLGIARGLKGSEGYLQELVRLTGKSVEDIRKGAQEALFFILHDYSRFRIETIDSFFQSVMRNLARELELGANLSIELNNTEVLSDAVDVMLEKLDRKSPVLYWLLEYIEERISDDKRWDVSDDIKSFGRNIFEEEYVERGEELRRKLDDPKFIPQFRKELKELREMVLEQMKGFSEQFLGVLETQGLSPDDLKNGSRGIGSYFRKIARGELLNKVSNTTVQKCLESEENWTTKSSPKRQEILAVVSSDLMGILEEAEKMRPKNNWILNSCDLALKYLNNLRLLTHMDAEVRLQNQLHNRFLLSDTNALLHGLISRGDASFVYEKIGTQIDTVMIDEFQDTSRMQWENFHLLLEESLAQKEGSLIVGDIKQSIYRWRNGDWKILAGLGKDPVLRVKECTLDTNWRSEKRIIGFNNAFFPTACQLLSDRQESELGKPCEELLEAYSDVRQKPAQKEEKGYVKVTLLPDSEEKAYSEAMLEALAEDAGLLAGSMPRTVKDALSDLYAQGATFLPAVEADEALTAAGYGILKGDSLAGWAEGDAALGVNLVLGQVDADVVELPLDGGGVAALRVVGARTSVRPVMDGGALTGLSLTCTLDANMAEGNLDLRTEEVHASLEAALAQVEEARIRSALELAQELDADYLGLLRRAALARPWHKEALEGASLGALELELHVTAKLQRSYDAAR